MNTRERRLRAFFGRYSRNSNAALLAPDSADIGALAGAFAGHFVGAGPAGVMGGTKDPSFPDTLRQGFRAYRAMGGTRFEIIALDVEMLDDANAMVRADWEFDYLRPRDGAKGTIAFRNIYFVNFAGGDAKIFAWITPDEAQAMKDHGLI